MKTSNTAARCELSNHSDCLTFWRSSHMRFAFQGPEVGSSAEARWGTHFDTQPKMAYCDITSQGVSVKLISNKGWNAAADEVLECQVDLSRSALGWIVNDDVLRWSKVSLNDGPSTLGSSTEEFCSLSHKNTVELGAWFEKYIKIHI